MKRFPVLLTATISLAMQSLQFLPPAIAGTMTANTASTANDSATWSANLEDRPVKQKWAVVVGAAKFKEKRLSEESLETDAAAKSFYDYLVDPNGGRFDASHVKLLINSTATKSNIMGALTDQFLAPMAGPDDLVVVFIATNGFPTTDGGTYLCAYDCALDNVYSTCVPMTELMDKLKKNLKSDRVVMILESRYSGAAELNAGAKGLFPIYNIDIDKVLLGKGSMLLSSSGANEMTVNDNFSQNLIAALKEQNGLIALSKAFEIAKQKTEDEAAKSNPARHQTPVLKTQWKGNELVLGTPSVGGVSELPDSIKSYISAEEIDQKGAEALASGDTKSAITLFKKAIETNPNHAQSLANCGAAYYVDGDATAAADMYKQALAKKPDDAQFHADYAVVLTKLGDDSGSIEQLEAALKLDPKNVTVLSALGAREMSKKNYRKAEKDYRAAFNLYPKSGKFEQRLSFAMAQNGAGEPAIQFAKEAATLEPDSVSAQMNLGSVLTICNKEKAALAAFEGASKLDPNNPEVHYVLSKSYETNGNMTAAVSELNRFIQLCPATDARVGDAKTHISDLSSSKTK